MWAISNIFWSSSTTTSFNLSFVSVPSGLSTITDLQYSTTVLTRWLSLTLWARLSMKVRTMSCPTNELPKIRTFAVFFIWFDLLLLGEGLKLSDFYSGSSPLDLALDLAEDGGCGTIAWDCLSVFSAGFSVRPKSLAIFDVKLDFSGVGCANTSLWALYFGTYYCAF